MRLSLLGSETISIKRYAGDDVLDQETGLYNDGTFTIIAATASIQPMKGRDLLLLPEADRIRHSVRIYSATELIEGDEVTRSKNDDVFFIRTDNDWSTQLTSLAHYKVIGFLKDDTA